MCLGNCFTLIWKYLIYNELSDAVAKFMAGDKCDSVNVHQERGPFTLQGMCKKRGPYKKERLSHILATNVFGLTNSVTKFMVELARSQVSCIPTFTYLIGRIQLLLSSTQLMLPKFCPMQEASARCYLTTTKFFQSNT